MRPHLVEADSAPVSPRAIAQGAPGSRAATGGGEIVSKASIDLTHAARGAVLAADPAPALPEAISGRGDRAELLGSPVQLGEWLDLPILQTDLAGMISEANEAAARLFGLDAAGLRGRSIASGALSCNQALASQLLADTQAGGRWRGQFGVEGDIASAAVNVRATLICGADGRPAGVAVAFLELVDRGVAPRGEPAGEAQRRAAQRTAGVGAWEWDPLADQLFVSESFTSLLGLSGDARLSMSDALAAMLPEDRRHVRATIDRTLYGDRDSFVLRYRIRGADGDLLWLEAGCEAHRDENGRVVRVYGVSRNISEQVDSQEHLHRAEEFWHATLDSLSGQVAVLDERGVILAVNQAWREFAFREGGTGDYVGANYLSVCDSSDDELGRRAGEGLRDVLAGQSDLFELEYPCHNQTEERWVLLRAIPHDGSGGIRVVVAHENVTERRNHREQAYLQAALLDEVDVAIVVTGSDGEVRTWNAGAERLFGWPPEEAIGRRTSDFLAVNGASKLRQARSSESGRWAGETTYLRKDGSRFPGYIRTRLVPSLDGQDTAVVGVVIDITEQQESERQLRLARDYLRAVTDSIGEGVFTLDIYGRVTYMNPAAERQLGWPLDEIRGGVMHEISHNRRPDGSVHPIGECPILGARRDGSVVRVKDDVFMRRDGRELPVAYTATPFAASSGIEGCVVVFEDITERKAQARLIERDLEKLAWVKRIREALEEDRFVLYAQPIMELGSGREVQRELLIRMSEPDSSRLIAPGAFLPVAEELGLITDIDRWVITRSAEIAASGLAVELNVSAASIGEPGLIGFIQEAISAAGADPRQMVFEITETALVDDEAAGRRFVEALHEIGCKVALDDFGTGYGGFTYIKKLPIDFLKIDIEFVRDLVDNAASRNVVEAVVGLAQGFELKTVAEGVEDEATLTLLRELGVDYAQGYHIGRPGPLPGRGPKENAINTADAPGRPEDN
jgi:PAS domain S-box-containing protein